MGRPKDNDLSRRVLRVLDQHPRCAREIGEHLNIPQKRASGSLTYLTLKGVVTRVKMRNPETHELLWHYMWDQKVGKSLALAPIEAPSNGSGAAPVTIEHPDVERMSAAIDDVEAALSLLMEQVSNLRHTVTGR